VLVPRGKALLKETPKRGLFTSFRKERIASAEEEASGDKTAGGKTQRESAGDQNGAEKGKKRPNADQQNKSVHKFGKDRKKTTGKLERTHWHKKSYEEILKENDFTPGEQKKESERRGPECITNSNCKGGGRILRNRGEVNAGEVDAGRGSGGGRFERRNLGVLRRFI